MADYDDIHFGLDSDGNLTMSAIDFKDHDGQCPHIHDIDMNGSADDYDSNRGDARELTETEVEQVNIGMGIDEDFFQDASNQDAEYGED